MQHTATYCNTLQRTATHCNTLQHTGPMANPPSSLKYQLFTSFQLYVIVPRTHYISQYLLTNLLTYNCIIFSYLSIFVLWYIWWQIYPTYTFHIDTYYAFHWNCYPSDIQQNTSLRFSNISWYKIKQKNWSDLNLSQGMWFSIWRIFVGEHSQWKLSCVVICLFRIEFPHEYIVSYITRYIHFHIDIPHR